MNNSKYTLEDVVNFLTKKIEFDKSHKDFAARKQIVMKFLTTGINLPKELYDFYVPKALAIHQISRVEDAYYVKCDFDGCITVFKVQMDDENHVFLKITGKKTSYCDTPYIQWYKLELVEPVVCTTYKPVSCTTYL